MSLWGRSLTLILLAGMLMASIFALKIWSESEDRFPLRTVEIQGNLKYLKGTEIQNLVSNYMKRGFFWLDINAVQKEIQALPWVSAAVIKRHWPDKLSISIKEQIPQAIWNEEGILSTEGRLFYPELASLPDNLPHFNGPEAEARDMISHYFTFLEMLSPLGLAIAELNIAPDGTLSMRLDNGIAIILGKAAINDRMGRFVLVYPGSLQSQSHKIAYLDLRYTNGFAVGFKAQIQ